MAGMHNMMMGRGPGTIFRLDVDTYEDAVVDPFTPIMSWVVSNDGAIKTYSSTNGLASVGYNWVTPTSLGSDYWVRVQTTSGSFNYGGWSTNTWIDTVNSPEWGVTRSTAGFTQCTFNVQIASDSAGTNIVASANGITVIASLNA